MIHYLGDERVWGYLHPGTRIRHPSVEGTPVSVCISHTHVVHCTGAQSGTKSTMTYYSQNTKSSGWINTFILSNY